ncbi:tubulin-like doman-containing protein [Nitrospirillum sp. BR 11752]|uniref:tubulin-like doman-containing protein n=1 Tax=Nitrospirillum sp. BR 11752 TaxID=3104293 RepID=UPI002EC1DEC9|nr:tubulin-like doman-containing protein [Nitrospirillum sp. BR 11752]
MGHLVIGLGGTGGKVIRALRKQIYAEMRAENPGDVKIAYLYVDSSGEMMAQDDPSWKVLGYSVQLPLGSQLRITGEDLSARLANIDTYAGIKPWIGDRATWGDVLGSVVGAALGGQKRRLGRFLFACKIDQFRKQVQSAVKELQSTGVGEVTFHVVAGLAGGTGSGAIIDALAQLRDLYDDSLRYRIIPYLLLPERHPNPNWDTGNYHSNGYAALLELNALSTTAYKPWDVTGVRGRLTLRDAFNGAYLFGNENENGYQADVDRELPGILADFLYQKIVVASQVGWRSLERMENAENGDGAPETAPGQKVGERSKRFLSFGIKRVAIPEEEIKEYLTLGFARQAIQQLRFNNWQEAVGFVDEARNADYGAFVRQADVLARWLLTEEHVTLSVALLPQDDAGRKWKPITQEWEAVLPTFKSLVRERERSTWLDELAKLCQKRFDEDYRNLGVPTFYRTKLKAKKDMAREIRVQVERELFGDWRTGVRSAAEVGRVVEALIDLLRERQAGVDEALGKLGSAIADCEARLAENLRAWAQMGFLSKSVFGKPDSLLDSHAIYLQELYVRRTRAEAWGFARQLIAEVVTEITELKGIIDGIASTMRDALKKVEAGIDQRLGGAAADDLRGHLIRFYDPALVKSVGRALMTDSAEQRTQTNAVRAALIARLGDNQTFTAFKERVDFSALTDTIETVCARNAQVAHANLVTNARDRILGVSIIERLKERFGTDPQELKAFVSKLVTQAGCFLTMNPLEVNKSAPGIPVGVQTLTAKYIVILPKAPDHALFVEALKQAFRMAQPGDLEFIESEGRENEITMIAIKNLFPVRYVHVLPVLQEKYEYRIAGNPVRARLELHTEGDGKDFPPLFVKSGDEVRKEAVPYLLLADATGLIHDGRTATGAAQLLLVTKDADGFDNDPIVLGASLLEAPDRVDLVALASLRDGVTAALAGAACSGSDARAALQRRILGRIDEMKAATGGDPQNPQYRAFVEGGKAAVRLLKGEAI